MAIDRDVIVMRAGALSAISTTRVCRHSGQPAIGHMPSQKHAKISRAAMVFWLPRDGGNGAGGIAGYRREPRGGGTIIRAGQLRVEPLLIGIRQSLASMCSSAQSIDTGRWSMLAKERLVFKIAPAC